MLTVFGRLHCVVILVRIFEIIEKCFRFSFIFFFLPTAGWAFDNCYTIMYILGKTESSFRILIFDFEIMDLC